MRPRDVEVMRRRWPVWSLQTNDVKKIAILSPSPEEDNLLTMIYPQAKRIHLTEKQWNLNDSSSETYDLVVASAVFMCAERPGVWFKNVMEASRYAWIQDHILAWRTPNAECAFHDGDVMRYRTKEHQARVSFAYDLNEVAQYTKDLVVYDVPSNSKEAKSFLLFLMSQK